MRGLMEAWEIDTWDGGFGVASIACLIGAAVLVTAGIIAGVQNSVVPPVAVGLRPAHQALYSRATTLLGGMTLQTAILVLLAVLFSVLAGGERWRRILPWAAFAGVVVGLGALVYAGITVWFYTKPGARVTAASTEIRLVGASLATVVVALAASWWATGRMASTSPTWDVPPLGGDAPD